MHQEGAACRPQLAVGRAAAGQQLDTVCLQRPRKGCAASDHCVWFVDPPDFWLGQGWPRRRGAGAGLEKPAAREGLGALWVSARVIESGIGEAEFCDSTRKSRWLNWSVLRGGHSRLVPCPACQSCSALIITTI